MTNQISTGSTSETITRDQIVDLRREAKAAGDYVRADLCGLALAGDVDAIRACECAISDTDAR